MMEIRYVEYKKEPKISWRKDASNLSNDLEKQAKYLFNLLLESLPSYTFRKLYEFMKEYMEKDK